MIESEDVAAVMQDWEAVERDFFKAVRAQNHTPLVHSNGLRD